MPSSLRDALEAGATIVTPNKRLARRIAALYDGAQLAAGRAAWPACAVLPWSAWLEQLWLETLGGGAVPAPPVLLRSAQAGHLWREIVAGDAPPLIDAAGAAVLAQEAWDLVHAWGAGGATWRGFADAGEDPLAFARWADAFAAALARRDAMDVAQLPDRIAHAPGPARTCAAATIALAGFAEFTPQQERLLAGLGASGVRIERLTTLPDLPGEVRLASGATPRDEIIRALQWARANASADPTVTIGIAVVDLATRRDEIAALADEILCPGLQWPGELSAARPWNLSLGSSLHELPVVAAAIDLIALAHGWLALPRAAALLRSPYLPGSAAPACARGAVEHAWLEEGRRTVTLTDAIAALSATDPALAQRWRAAQAGLPSATAASPRVWSDRWRKWLDAAGWPGERTLSSAEFQARGAWDEALAQFALLGPVAQRLTATEAVRAVEAIAAATLFQPETPEAPVQILGLLEAAALPFDALWVAGLAAESWPPAPRPHPFLPPDWQRERGAPHASAARELAYATALTEQFLRAAPSVVLSHPRAVDEHARSPSSLLPRAPELEQGPRHVSTAHRIFAAAPAHELVADGCAPPLAAGSAVHGGAALIEAQADCPFKAMATFRLRAEAWPDPVDGLAPMERGTLVHAALAAFWREVRTSAALNALAHEAVEARVHAAATEALASVPKRRWQALPPAVQAGEGRRLEGLIRAWLDGIERERPAFAVRDVEAQRTLALGNIVLNLRIDRIDALATGGIAIIDYKTGTTARPALWFDPRPQAPQLGLYMLAFRATDPGDAVRAAAFAQVRPGEMKAVGIAASADAWPALAEPRAVRGVDLAGWEDVEARWSRAFAAIAGEIAAGHAAVDPRDEGGACASCHLASLCRVGALALDAAAEGVDD